MIFDVVSNRHLWRLIHRWSGLVLGLLFVITGLTGSVMTFREPLDRWLNTPSDLPPITQTLSPSQLIKSVEKFYPSYRVERLRLDYEAGDIVLVRIVPKHASEIAPEVDEVWVHSTTGQVIAERLNSAFGIDKLHLIPSLFRLHYALFLEEPGQLFLGVVTVFWLVSTVAGVRLAWPKKNFLRVFLIKFSASKARVIYDLHRATGMVVFPILLILCFTGIYFNLNSLIRPVIDYIATTTPWPVSRFPVTNSSSYLQSPEASIEKAISTFPNGNPIRLVIDTTHAYHRIDLLRPSDIGETPETVAFISTKDGSHLATVSPEASTTGDRFIAWQYPLHTGEFLGTAGRVTWLLAGITPLILLVSGWLIWRKKVVINKC